MFKQILAGSAIATLLIVGGMSTANAQQAPQGAPAQGTTQVKVDDADLQRFATATKKIQTIQQQAQEQMVQAVEEQGLSVKRFNEIAQSQQNPAQAPADLSSEETQTFEAAIMQIDQIQEQAQGNMESAIEQQGLDLQTFNVIAQAVQQDPALQQQVMEIIQQ
ncbi:DUF4168 domain-containing protein [Synechocystis sp. B12]|nr:DUF4168 domain-containing protein [Synechocystis sp. B12]